MIILFSVAALFIFLGVAIKYFHCYWLISGYNTMSKEKKQKVDTQGLGNLLGNYCFLNAGLFACLAAAVELGLGWAQIMLGIVFALSTLYILIKAQSFDPSTRKEDGTMKTSVKLIIGSIALVFVAVGVLIYFSSLPAEINVTDESVEITGIYGETIPASEITGISISAHLPKVLAKTNGSNVGSRLKGNFRVEELGKVKLFVNADKPPFIVLHQGEEIIILNRDDPQKTKELYRKLADVAGN